MISDFRELQRLTLWRGLEEDTLSSQFEECSRLAGGSAEESGTENKKIHFILVVSLSSCMKYLLESTRGHAGQCSVSISDPRNPGNASFLLASVEIFLHITEYHPVDLLSLIRQLQLKY